MKAGKLAHRSVVVEGEQRWGSRYLEGSIHQPPPPRSRANFEQTEVGPVSDADEKVR